MMYLFHIISSIITHGISLMTLLRISAKRRPYYTAFVSDSIRMTYAEMYHKAKCLTAFAIHEYSLERGMRVALLCRNHEWSLTLLISLSRIGVDIILINTDLCAAQLSELLSSRNVAVLFHDEEYSDRIASLCLHTTLIAIEQMARKFNKTHKQDPSPALPSRVGVHQITIFTGGTSGHFITATRSSSVMQFLPPLISLLKDINVHRYASLLLALPLYHGFGLATFAVSLFLGKKICVMRRFDAKKAVSLIHQEQLEVLPIVPGMLSRMLLIPQAERSMKTLRCIISGGDRLDKNLATRIQQSLGNILFNLYGTTEAGFFLLAKPSDLASCNEIPLGKPIAGVKCCVRDKNADGVGVVWVKSRWAMIGSKNQWQSTGDMVVEDRKGYMFHRGRTDGMIVCGGENVYPENVQRILMQHPDIADAIVYPTPHPAFGKVLNAQVETIPSSIVTDTDILRWLKPRLSRAEMPHTLYISPITILPTGKRTSMKPVVNC